QHHRLIRGAAVVAAPVLVVSLAVLAAGALEPAVVALLTGVDAVCVGTRFELLIPLTGVGRTGPP
ncbi:MAG TPA: hypothetical protein VGE92_03725, partial [Steroidobacteraceae bacterium]